MDGGTDTIVQIPLWTIVTQPRKARIAGEEGSDSSMDDCNGRESSSNRPAAPFRFLYGRL